MRAGDWLTRAKWRRKVVFDALRRITALAKVTQYEGQKNPGASEPWVAVVFQARSSVARETGNRDGAKARLRPLLPGLDATDAPGTQQTFENMVASRRPDMYFYVT